MIDYQVVGVDVAKDKFDVALELNNQTHQACFCNNKSGYRSFSKWLAKHTMKPWVCMEATGHYSELIADYLVSQDVPVSVINPLQIKSFARATLSRNKTDALDAKLIAAYGSRMQPKPFTPRSDLHKELKDLSNLLDSLKTQRVQLSNQLQSAQSLSARKMIRRLLKALDNEIKAVESAMEDLIKSNNELNNNLELLTSIPGVGKQTAFKVISHIPNMNAFSHAKQFAAYLGVTPRQHQSGKYVGKAVISKIGNAGLRKVFYMAGLVAKRHNKSLQPFVERLKAKGKAPKAIICAVMRKLAHLVFGVLKSGRPFDVNYI